MAAWSNDGVTGKRDGKRKAELLEEEEDVLDLSQINTDEEARNHSRVMPLRKTTVNASTVNHKGKHGVETIDLDQIPDRPAAIEIDSDDERESVEGVDEFTLHEYIGSFATRIVGVQYYRGAVTTGEMVLLRREPNNNYDKNAIQVLNMRNAQVGHLPAQVASGLAPWLDQRVCLAEGSVKAKKQVYSIPITINIFAHHSVASQMPRALARAGIDLEMRERNGMAGASDSGAVNGAIDLDTLRAGSTTVNTRQAAALLDQLVVTTKDLQKMSKALQPSRLSTKLLDYQLQGLHWMIEKENPALPTGKETVQMWKKASGKSSGYVNIASNFTMGEAPKLGRGGLLADDMGLGKTLQLLALIVATAEEAPDVSVVEESKNERYSGATLVICPASLMSNWENQSREHSAKDSTIDLEVYHGQARSSRQVLESRELVISTYGTLRSEYALFCASKKPASGLFSVRWRRIILDEAHQIRNAKSQGSLAVNALTGSRRWALTGTPVVNSYSDLGAIIRFVGWSGGLEKPEIFNAKLTRKLLSPGEAVRQEAVKLIQILMQDLSLRRRKDMEYSGRKLIDLPGMKEYHHKLAFETTYEKETYDKLTKQAQGILKSASGYQQSQVLELLMRLRQACCATALISEERLKKLEKLDEMDSVEFTEENKLLLQDFLGLAIESQECCPVCMEEISDASRVPVVTYCKHVFCRQCLTACLAEKESCPLCRASLKVAQTLEMPKIVSPIKGDPDTAHNSDGDKSSSTKIEGLLRILKAIASQDASNKTIVFSQWTKMLDLIAFKFAANDMSFCRIDGSMSLSARDASIRRLQGTGSEGTNIMLASLAVASVGLNLTAANSVILVDPWWSPAIEDQAVDRVYRLGQTREVSVYKLMIEDTIEEKVLEIQDRKRKMTATVGIGQSRIQQIESRRADLEALLGS